MPSEARAGRRDKKLLYVLNKVDEHDVSHFYHVLNLIKALEGLGWEIRLLSEKGGAGVRTVAGVPVHYLSRSNPLARVLGLTCALIKARLRGYRLVYVRISTPAALVTTTLGRLLGLRTFFWNSGMNHDVPRHVTPISSALDNAAFRTIVALTDRFVTGPESMIEYCAQYQGVPRNRLALLYNDVDLARFAPRKERRPSGDAVTILSVHRFSPAKQITLYLPGIIAKLNQIATEARPIILELVGDGPEMPEVRRAAEAASAHLTIRIPGSVPNAQITDCYERADIFIMPSRREGMPRVLIEAMAMGLPIVTTDAGGTLDLVGPQQRAYVVSRDSGEAFGEALAALVERPESWKALAEENLQRAQRYSTPAVARMYDELLTSRIPVQA